MSTTAIVDSLTAVPATPLQPERAQCLADGAAGVALLHIERALTDAGHWETACRWLSVVVRGGVLGTVETSLYRGAPAVAFVLHAATRSGRYAEARQTLDEAVSGLVIRRVDQALERIARGARPTMAEFDLISGLTGIGAHLLRHTSHSDALPRVLGYLVRLTEPLRHDGETLPGWWTEQDPHAGTSPAFPGGHANHGLAHGIAGPLALLALAKRRGILVDGHLDAIERICAWLDAWRQHRDTGDWWPQWVTKVDHRAGRTSQPGPLRPSWCYGTPGLARAQQLAALATGDAARRCVAERALASCLADQHQLDRISDPGLCHGWAGLLLTVMRTDADAQDSTLAQHVPRLVEKLFHSAAEAELAGDGLLEGRAGVALALYAAERGMAASGWDACLLIN